ncbi:hypothetical protein P8452_41961 [Trifolium repens]|nr:hypothetical protein P8452_41961 [Trifolium repens]
MVVNSQGSTVIWKPKSQGLLVEDTGVKSMLVGNENVGGSGVGVLHAQIRAIFYLKFENENSDQEEQLHQVKLNQTVYCRLSYGYKAKKSCTLS